MLWLDNVSMAEEELVLRTCQLPLCVKLNTLRVLPYEVFQKSLPSASLVSSDYSSSRAHFSMVISPYMTDCRPWKKKR